MEPLGASVPSLMVDLLLGERGRGEDEERCGDEGLLHFGVSPDFRRNRSSTWASRARARRWATRLASRCSGRSRRRRPGSASQHRLEGGPVLLLDEHASRPRQTSGPSFFPPERASARVEVAAGHLGAAARWPRCGHPRR